MIARNRRSEPLGEVVSTDAAVKDWFVLLAPVLVPVRAASARPASQEPSPLSKGRRDGDAGDDAIPSDARARAAKNADNASANNANAHNDDASNGDAKRPIGERPHVRLLRLPIAPAWQPASLRSVAEPQSQESLQQQRPQLWSDAWLTSRRCHLYALGPVTSNPNS